MSLNPKARSGRPRHGGTPPQTETAPARTKGSTMTATRVDHDSLGPVNVAGDRKSTRSIRGADLVVRNLEAQGVRHVFGVPGAKIGLVRHPIQPVMKRELPMFKTKNDLAQDVRSKT